MSKNYSCTLRHENKGIYEWQTNRKVTELIQFKSENKRWKLKPSLFFLQITTIFFKWKTSTSQL